ncbi:MAG TPA: succinylglutamate desuccinylase/aspartoacylase family protein [bacterium]|nr:succinylglutamate desuccinylase/aspartoacylase family protein [bacterium]
MYRKLYYQVILVKISKHYIPLFKGIDQSTRRLPFLMADSGQSGPVICLTAAIHGDEVTGTAVIHKIFKRFEKDPLRSGIIYGFPILNPTGFEAISRRDIYGGEDLNRAFPGKEYGNTAERHAWIIGQNIRNFKPDYVIDLHTDSFNSIIYTIVDYIDGEKHQKTFARSVTLAAQLGITWVVDTEETGGYDPATCLTGYLIARGIPAVTVELGAPFVVMEPAKHYAVDAIWQFLAGLGMIAGQLKQHIGILPKRALAATRHIYTQSSGIVEYKVTAGQKITRGQTLGRVKNVFGETIETITAPVNGLLLSHEDQSVTFPGMELFTLAEEVSMRQYVPNPLTLKVEYGRG